MKKILVVLVLSLSASLAYASDNTFDCEVQAFRGDTDIPAQKIQLQPLWIYKSVYFPELKTTVIATLKEGTPRCGTNPKPSYALEVRVTDGEFKTDGESLPDKFVVFSASADTSTQELSVDSTVNGNGYSVECKLSAPADSCE